MSAVTTRDRCALVQGKQAKNITIDECYFRMLEPEEILLGMGFWRDYKVLGTKRQRVRQCGTAVTLPPAEWLFRQGVSVL